MAKIFVSNDENGVFGDFLVMILAEKDFMVSEVEANGGEASRFDAKYLEVIFDNIFEFAKDGGRAALIFREAERIFPYYADSGQIGLKAVNAKKTLSGKLKGMDNLWIIYLLKEPGDFDNQITFMFMGGTIAQDALIAEVQAIKDKIVKKAA